jgi:hypothetical protein
MHAGGPDAGAIKDIAPAIAESRVRLLEETNTFGERRADDSRPRRPLSSAQPGDAREFRAIARRRKI